MKLSVEALDTTGYRLLEKMDHNQLMPFVTTYLNKRNAATISFVAASMVFLCAIILLTAKTIAMEKSGLCIAYLVGGSVAAYALIPIHEYIHALAYKGCGAKNISFDVNFKKFVFLTVADKFVADKPEFFKIALAPFMVITLALVAVLPFIETYWQLSVFGMLFIHTLFCIGDFGLISYFLSHNGKTIVTYDDKMKKETHFYVLNRSTQARKSHKKSG